MRAKISGTFLIALILTIFPMELKARSIPSVVVGSLAPAVLKCVEKKFVGVEVSKIYPFLIKAGDGLDKFSPSEIIYTIIVFAASFLPFKRTITVVLFIAGIIKAIIGLTERPFSGTAFLLEKLSNAIEARC